MRFSLRSGSSWMYVTFNDVGHDIMGRNFEIEHENNINRIYINLDENLKSGQEELNSYMDTKDLICEHRQLNGIQIRDLYTCNKVLNFKDKHLVDSWCLELTYDNNKYFRYSINVDTMGADDIYLNVKGICD